MAEFETWRLLAGLGLFLFGMYELELALTRLAGRSFKKFLRQHTRQPVKAVLAGALATAALQSSSVVSLIVLAFVGTGIITLASGLGIGFGSNLGTTATGWIVATIGFKLDIEALALPLVALGGFGVVWSAAESRRAGFSHLVIGLGLMLMGLEFMKSGATSATELFDPEALARYPAIVFLLVGLVITAVIQSSSATIMVTMTALFAGVIPLEAAAAVAIGADLGSTVTALLGALAGSVAKKRVAVALIIFNVVTDLVAFVLLDPLLGFIQNVLGIGDPLFVLVAFHSLFNLIGIALFLPAIPALSHWLEYRIGESETPLLRHLQPEATAVPEAAVENIRQETRRLIDQAATLNLLSFGLPPGSGFYAAGDDRQGVPLFESEADYASAYLEIKQLEGEILAYALSLQAQSMEPSEAELLGRLITSVRNAVHAAKSIKDTHHDLESFGAAVDDHYNSYLGHFRAAAAEFYQLLESLRPATTAAACFEILVALKDLNERLHSQMHARIHAEVAARALEEDQISTLLNVNREQYQSNMSLLAALGDTLLDASGARDFDSLPVRDYRGPTGQADS